MITSIAASTLVLSLLSAGCAVGTNLGSNQTASPAGATPAATTPASAGPAAAAPTFLTLPDLTGMTEAEARQKLTDAGVTGNIYTRDDSGCESRMEIAAGSVCGQQPRAGARQGSRLAVTLELARSTEHGGVGTNQEWVKMPNVVGMTIDEATAVMEKAGFTNIEFQQRPAAECKPGIVCRQNPEAGKPGRLKLLKTLFVGVE